MSRPDSRPDRPTDLGTPADGRGRLPTDLAPDERGLASWFAHLGRPEADDELPARVLDALPADVARPEPALAEPEEVRRMWAWWTAAAAIVLLALGVNVIRGEAPERLERGAHAGSAAPLALTRPATERHLWVMNDPNLALYHDLETFDHLGLEESDMLALGGR